MNTPVQTRSRSARSAASGRGASARGFTLIEVMITVAIVAILASVAYPSYREHIAKGRRAQATAELLGAHQWMERFYSENFRYNTNSGGTATDGAAGLFAQLFPQVPIEGAATYTARLSAVAAQSYTITATRTGSMATDRCGNFTINHLGVRSIAAGTFDASAFADVNAAIAACWRQ